MYQYYYLLLYYFQAAATNQKLQQEFCSAVSFHHCFQVVTTKNYSKNPVLLLMSFSYYQKYSKTPLFLYLGTPLKQLLPKTIARILYYYLLLSSSYYHKLQQELYTANSLLYHMFQVVTTKNYSKNLLKSNFSIMPY